MKKYQQLNNVTGWIVFAIAAITYCMTAEPTASFWDCPEFITTAYKLEVGHPPGAPFFMLMGNFFSLFAPSTAHVAYAINIMSALMSALCILFLFWTITHLVRKMVLQPGVNQAIATPTTAQLLTILGSGVVGALAYTWSDTFWFSAVEAEVYGSSSLFTAVVFWLILKWEDSADDIHSDRWLILIAYLTGLSIGVHLLNLLCIPAIVLVYYFKKKPDANIVGTLLALAASVVLIGAVLYGMVPGVVKVGGWFELFFVNDLSMPFNTGLIIYMLLLIGITVWAMFASSRDLTKMSDKQAKSAEKQMHISFLLTIAFTGIPFIGYGLKSYVFGFLILAALGVYLLTDLFGKLKISQRTINTTALSIFMILVGYSSYAVIVIRSAANPPMDQNSPEDVFTLGEYLGREQYGTRPLFYGPQYSSRVQLEVEGNYCKPVGVQGHARHIRKEKDSAEEKDSYKEMPGRMDYKYAQNVFFPRMYSSTHAQHYENWMDIEGNLVPYDDCGKTVQVKVPTQWENLSFFFSYQLNFMYWRYFMWNFAGRQNDIQGHGEIEHGNWITGISFIDNVLVGDQSLAPKSLLNNKGHNVFFCLPLLLGLLGLFWQLSQKKRGQQQFWVVFMLFFMTGIAIVIYLNQYPMQPRERDYAYAGSFYAFAIWIGMGVAALAEALRDILKNKPALAAGIACALALLVPIQMVSQTWDDHDRSVRYVTRDFGQNYLMTTQDEANPIIYTNGDNDTFPLWYNQEVEGFRTDVRVCNLSYLQTDWYIDQMKRPQYKSPSLPITWDRTEYVEGANDYIAVEPHLMRDVMKLYNDAKAKDEARGDGKQTALKKVQKAFGENPYELRSILNHWAKDSKSDLHVIPTDSIVLKVDKEAIKRSGMLLPENDSIPEYMHISLKGKRSLYKSELMMLEMLANSNWERPIYIAISVGSGNMLGMESHFTQEGLAYRFTPFDTKKEGTDVDTEKMYNNLMTRYKFGGISTPGVYLDENTMRMCYTHRRLFATLTDGLIAENKMDKAKEALAKAAKEIPNSTVAHDYVGGSLNLAINSYKLDMKEEGDAIMKVLADDASQYIAWYLSMNDMQLAVSQQNIMRNYYLLDEYVRQMTTYKSDMASHYTQLFDQLYNAYRIRLGGGPRVPENTPSAPVMPAEQN